MPVRKRKKKTRQRRAHGWGSRKKHRGKGHKGGAGKSGHGKRTNPKQPSIWKDTKYFGKYGFKRKSAKIHINPLNIKHLDEKIEKLVESKIAKKEKDVYTVNLEELGFNKLLGSGKINKKIIITAQYASKKAIEAVENAGGKVIVPEKKKEEKKEKVEKKKEKVKETKEKTIKKDTEKVNKKEPEEKNKSKVKEETN